MTRPDVPDLDHDEDARRTLRTLRPSQIARRYGVTLDDAHALIGYLGCTEGAREHRQAGRIGQALRSEAAADRHYQRLSERARW